MSDSFSRSASKPENARLTPRRRRFAVVAALAFAVLASSSCGRLYRQAPVGGAPAAGEEVLSVAFLVGDFGKPAAPFEDLVEVLADEAAALVPSSVRTAPVILELGDNLYEDGLPRVLDGTGAQQEVDKLRSIADSFTAVQHAGSQVPLVLVPGNHDYYNDALTNEANRGDISRWYFLEELGVAGADAWVQVPGDASKFAGSQSLYDHLDEDPEAHAAFMMPMAAPHFDPAIYVVAVDSELILDLYDQGHEALVDQYWRGLEDRLSEAPAEAWVMVASHHPPVTYGKHGRPGWGNWVFGQGWPQFPRTWQKALAFVTPLAIALGIVVHPAAVALAAVTPATTALVTGRKQDVGSDPYDRYAAELLRIAAARDVDVLLAGHDHNTQLIELAAVEGFDDDTLLVITGAGAKVDPVRRGDGTVAFLADYSFVRMTQYRTGLAFEIVDRSGDTRFRYNLGR